MPLDSARPGFVEELCIALAHRWEPERLFMIFTAYFDESDSHGSKPDLILSGFLGTARQWELFERKLRRLQEREGFGVLRAKQLKGTLPKGWDEEKRDRIGWGLLDLMAKLARCATVVVPHELYSEAYRGSPSPPKMRLDSQYGLCFRYCLLHFVRYLMEDGKNHKLHAVIEDGHRNVQDTVRVFGELRDTLDGYGVDILRTITVAKKHEALPLMAADLIAHIGALDFRGGEFDRDGDVIRHKREIFHTRIWPTPEDLQVLKDHWALSRDKQIEEWRARRDAKRASLRGPS
jgi:hypothetical protein